MVSVRRFAITGYLHYIFRHCLRYVRKNHRLRKTFHLAILKTGAIYGLGIFSMHFVGMYALIYPGPMQYDLLITIFSLLVAISGTTITMLLIYQKQRLWAVATLFGLTICSMHYAGMLSILANAYHMHHRVELLLVAVVYAISGSYLSLRFFVGYLRKHNKQNLLLSATAMGVTISGMHYLAMMAMEFSASVYPPVMPHSAFITRELIITFTIFMLLFTIAMYINDSFNSEKSLTLKKHELEFSNKSISSALEKLKTMQDQLIESGKMASLGQLVTGVAHEINTPVGICITSASYLKDQSSDFFERFQKQELTRQDFAKYMDAHQTSSKLIIENLSKASELIRSFKQVAVDQSTESPRQFFMGHYIKEVLASLNHKIKNKNFDVVFECQQDFEVETFAGSISIILNNLIDNSLIHGFENRDEGTINIKVSQSEEDVSLAYADDGCGMEQNNIDQIFSPFFTTKRSKGFCGLGMHIVFNQATQKLKGKLSCSSKPDQGVQISVVFPKIFTASSQTNSSNSSNSVKS